MSLLPVTDPSDHLEPGGSGESGLDAGGDAEFAVPVEGVQCQRGSRAEVVAEVDRGSESELARERRGAGRSDVVPEVLECEGDHDSFCGEGKRCAEIPGGPGGGRLGELETEHPRDGADLEMASDPDGVSEAEGEFSPAHALARGDSVVSAARVGLDDVDLAVVEELDPGADRARSGAERGAERSGARAQRERLVGDPRGRRGDGESGRAVEDGELVVGDGGVGAAEGERPGCGGEGEDGGGGGAGAVLRQSRRCGDRGDRDEEDGGGAHQGLRTKIFSRTRSSSNSTTRT